jgi:hypothetical protein
VKTGNNKEFPEQTKKSISNHTWNALATGFSLEADGTHIFLYRFFPSDIASFLSGAPQALRHVLSGCLFRKAGYPSISKTVFLLPGSNR